jgi:hypothetical protein
MMLDGNEEFKMIDNQKVVMKQFLRIVRNI